MKDQLADVPEVDCDWMWRCPCRKHYCDADYLGCCYEEPERDDSDPARGIGLALVIDVAACGLLWWILR